MSAPTFVTSAQSLFDSANSPKTASVTTQTGDVLVVCAVGESDSVSPGTPTGGSLTYTSQQDVQVSAYTRVHVWTAIATANATFNVSVTGSLGHFGITVLQFRNSNGVGASAQTNNASGAPSLALTTTGANSAVVAVVGDWNAGDGSTRTWRTVNSITPTAGNGGERTYALDSGAYTVYAGYWSDAGAAGSKTTGLSAPTGQKYAIVAVEVQGTASGTNATVNASTIAAVAALPAASESAGSTVTPAVVTATATLPAASESTGSTVSPSAIAAVAAFPSASKSTGATVTPAVVTATATVLAAAVRTGSTVSPAVVAAVAAIPGGAVQAGGGAVVMPATIAAVVAFPSASKSAGSTVRPSAIVASATLPAATASGGATVKPAAIAAVATFPAVELQTGGALVYTRLGGQLSRVGVRGSVRVNGAPVAFAIG